MNSTIPSRRSVLGTLFAFSATFLALGCGEKGGEKLHTVTGTVTFDGAPLSEGQISFRQLQGNVRTFSGPIKDGKYEVKAETGDMVVEIVATRAVPGKMDTTTNPGMSEPVMEMYIPTKYNKETSLKAKVEGDATFPFDLTSGKKK